MYNITQTTQIFLVPLHPTVPPPSHCSPSITLFPLHPTVPPPSHCSFPVPKKPKITCLNDYRPVALTSVVMKVFERLVLSYLKASTDHLMDPLQFAYRPNRSVDDAINIALH